MLGLALSALAAAATPTAAPFPLEFENLPVPAGPFAHTALSEVLSRLAWTGGKPVLPSSESRQALSRYLGTIARLGPSTRPELFPSREDVLAYLVDAHVAWVIAFANAPPLAGLDLPALRRVAFPLDGGQWTLASLEGEVTAAAPAEPRLALCLNPGLRDGPPLPATALEGYALSWQLAVQAHTCGSAKGFWGFDRGARTVRLAAVTASLPGLPPSQPERARRLLDLVPPPDDVRAAILGLCGRSLQGCTIELAPPPTTRR